MRLFYTVAYWVGVRPWEQMATLPVRHQVHALLDREETEREPPFGQALDLGCGTGIWAVRLAARGWHVTGIDIVGKALRQARRRVRDAGVDVRLVHGDITRIGAAGIGAGYQFVLDLGAIHGLGERERVAVGRQITAITSPKATLLTAAWVPARRGPLPRGASRSDIEEAFRGWSVVADEACDVTGAPWFVRNAQPRFYRLRRD